MTTKMAKVIAFELGLVIAILTWIAYDGLPWAKPEQELTVPEIADQSLGMISPIYQPVQQNDPVDYRADDLETDQSLDDRYADQGYAHTVANRNSVAPDGIVFSPRDPADSVGTFPEPVLGDDFYYPGYNSGYGYYSPAQIVVLSPARQSGRRGHYSGRGHRSLRPAHVRRGPSRSALQRRPAPRLRSAPWMQGRRIASRSGGLSYGRVAMQRRTTVARPRIAAKRSSPASRSRSVQTRRARPQR